MGGRGLGFEPARQQGGGMGVSEWRIDECVWSLRTPMSKETRERK